MRIAKLCARTKLYFCRSSVCAFHASCSPVYNASSRDEELVCNSGSALQGTVILDERLPGHPHKKGVVSTVSRTEGSSIRRILKGKVPYSRTDCSVIRKERPAEDDPWSQMQRRVHVASGGNPDNTWTLDLRETLSVRAVAGRSWQPKCTCTNGDMYVNRDVVKVRRAISSVHRSFSVARL